MEQFFQDQLPNGEHPDIQLCIFPHLKECLVIDLRPTGPQAAEPRVILMNAEEVFDEEFFKSLETEFSQTLREERDFLFAHLINLPLRLEEIVRGVAMSFVLDRLGVDQEDEEHLPTVLVFVISGGALAMHSKGLIDSLRKLLGSWPDQSAAAEWEAMLTRLVVEENTALQKINHLELSDALASDSPDYFTLWENRN